RRVASARLPARQRARTPRLVADAAGRLSRTAADPAVEADHCRYFDVVRFLRSLGDADRVAARRAAFSLGDCRACGDRLGNRGPPVLAGAGALPVADLP